MTGAPRILVVDNRDSFVFTIVQYLRELGADCTVRDRAEITPATPTGFDGVLLSPGPGHPADTGPVLELVRNAALHRTPLLGVCLGHQVIAHVHGAVVARAPRLVHGHADEVHHDGAGVFDGLPNPGVFTRYHSLAVRPESVPAALQITARTSTGVVMGLRHRRLPIEGVQFHPESVLSECGHRLLGNWLTSLATTERPAASPTPLTESAAVT